MFCGHGMIEPPVKRTVAFIDRQNLFHASREAFGRPYPDYDVVALATQICVGANWALSQTRFYTGVPDAADNPFWHRFWTAKLAVMGRQNVHVFSRSLRYQNRAVVLPDGTIHTFLSVSWNTGAGARGPPSAEGASRG